MKPVPALIEYLKQRFPVNRVVALLTVLVFVPLAGSITAWAAKHFPGLPIPSKGTITAGLAIGAAGAVSIGYKFLTNWGAHEDRLHRLAEQAQVLAHELHLAQLDAEIAQLAAETKKQVAAIEAGSLHIGDVTPPSPPPSPPSSPLEPPDWVEEAPRPPAPIPATSPPITHTHPAPTTQHSQSLPPTGGPQ